ncbi:MAG: C-type lectin domain-containing protein, partial [Verrucomicrobia bacterium]|nr:C-type lectin domain-containing protein [Verrucomicrobiota bacterium]
SLTLPFTPSNFVVGVGQLDGLGAEEIVLGADGNPGASTNFLLVLNQGPTSWSTQRVDVGQFGVTSIAVGQPAGRPTVGIYVGLREANGAGRVLEFTSNGAIWQSNLIAVSTHEPAFVGGVRRTGDLLVNFATNGMAGTLWSLAFSNAAWSASLVSSNGSHRGAVTHGPIPSRVIRDASIRLLDAGGIEVIGGDFEAAKDGIVLPTNAIPNDATGKWHFNTPRQTTWDEAQNYFTNYHGSLVTINSSEENNWLVSQLRSGWVDDQGWIGLHWQYEGWRYVPYWTSHDRGGFRTEIDPQSREVLWAYPNVTTAPVTIVAPGFVEFRGSNLWYIVPREGQRIGIGEVKPPVETFTNRWLIPAAPATSNLVWRSLPLETGQTRPGATNQSAILHCFVDDRNGSGSVDAADAFVFAEYQISNNTVLATTRTNLPLGSGVLAQSFAVAAVDLLDQGLDTVFTGEPGGGIYSWAVADTSSPLQRRMFSQDYAGKAWHALAGVRMAAGGESLAGLLVHPGDQSVCSVILWPPQAILAAPQSRVMQTAPVASVLPQRGVAGTLVPVRTRLWDAEGNASTPFLQYRLPGTTNWRDAAIAFLDGAPYSTANKVPAPPEGSDHVLTWDGSAVYAATGATNFWFRARALDVTLLGDWSEPMLYALTVPRDADGDGLPDDWEMRYFGDTGQDENADPDNDGIKNIDEYRYGLDPTRRQELKLSISLDPSAVWLHWATPEGALAVLERSEGLSRGDWTSLSTSSPYSDGWISPATFYRLRLQRVK